MLKFSPALGMIFGCALGSIAGLLTSNNLALSAGMGTGLGLVAGTFVYAFAMHSSK